MQFLLGKARTLLVITISLQNILYYAMHLMNELNLQEGGWGAYWAYLSLNPESCVWLGFCKKSILVKVRERLVLFQG